MVKRHYFMSIRRSFDDESPSYSFNSSTFTCVSLLPRPNEVFEHAKDVLTKSLPTESSQAVEVLSFSRI